MIAQPKIYYHSIDTFRFLCAVAVVIVHITSQIPSNDYATWSNYYFYRYLLDIGSPFFFMTAGFIIQQKYIAEGKNYLLSYAKKLLSYYVIFTLFYMGARVIIEVGFAYLSQESMRQALLTELNTWQTINILNGSIGSFQLYFLVILIFSALFIYLLLRLKFNTVAIFGLSLVLYLLQDAGILSALNIFEYKSFSFGLFFVSLGFTLSAIKYSFTLKAPIVYLFIFASSYVLNFYYQLGLGWLFLPLFAFSLGLFCIKHANVGKGTLLTKLSKYSLAIYTLHIFVELLLLKTVALLGWNDFYQQPLYYVIAIPLCVILPMFIFRPIYQSALWLKNRLMFTKPLSSNQ